MPKNKPNKGMLKRIRVTKSGRVKIGRAGGRHRRSHKTGKLLRSYRKNTYVPACEIGRIQAMLFRPLKSRARKDAAAEGASEKTGAE